MRNEGKLTILATYNKKHATSDQKSDSYIKNISFL